MNLNNSTPCRKCIQLGQPSPPRVVFEPQENVNPIQELKDISSKWSWNFCLTIGEKFYIDRQDVSQIFISNEMLNILIILLWIL